MARIALREACYAAIAARLAGQIADAPLERNRRSTIGPDEPPKQLVLRDGSQAPPEEGQSFGEDLWTVSATLEGYVTSSDADCGAEASDLYARAAEVLAASPIVPAGTFAGGMGVEFSIIEGALDFDAATVGESSAPIAAFYLELSFGLRAPSGVRFLNIP